MDMGAVSYREEANPKSSLEQIELRSVMSSRMSVVLSLNCSLATLWPKLRRSAGVEEPGVMRVD